MDEIVRLMNVPTSTGLYRIHTEYGDYLMFQGLSGVAVSLITDQELPPPPPPPPGDEVVVVHEQGVWHSATDDNPRRGEDNLPLSPGDYRGVSLSFEIYHGPWTEGEVHNLFWLVLNGNRNMFGYGNLGKSAKDARLRIGWGQAHGQKPKEEVRFNTQPDNWYSVRFDHQFGDQAVLTIKTLDGIRSASVALPSDVVDPLTVKEGDKLRLHTGFVKSENPNELPQVGWEWRNLRLTFERNK